MVLTIFKTNSLLNSHVYFALLKVGAINQKRTLAFLNHFITHTVRFMNRFSCVCEEKLEALAIRLQRLETSMNILEAKVRHVFYYSVGCNFLLEKGVT